MASSGKSPLKLIFTLVLLSAAGTAAYYYFHRQDEAQAPEYTTTTVTKGTLVQNITATGQLDPLTSVDVGSQISGLVKKLYVDYNSIVKKGDKLAEIDPATYQQRLRQAQADLASALAGNNLQRLNTERTKTLFEQKLVTQQDLDQAIAQLQQSDAQLLTRKAVVENAQVDLDRCTITSPIDGIVLTKSTEEGKTVAASLNAPVLFIIAEDLAKMQITASVAEADIGSVKQGQDVTFTVDAFPGREFKGNVSQVRNSPKTAQNVVTYETIIDVDNADLRLRPGMTTNVAIAVARRDNTLKIANAALRVRMPEGLIPEKTPPAAAQTTPAGESAKTPAAKDSKGSAPAGERRPRDSSGAPVTGGPPGGSGGGEGGSRRGSLLPADATPEQRQKVRDVMTELGFDFRNATAEQRAQLQKTLVERGLIPPPPAPGEAVITPRTVYRFPGGDKTATPEPVVARIGITDGIASEVVSGLNEGDVIITSVNVPGASGAPGAPASRSGSSSNPFSSRRF